MHSLSNSIKALKVREEREREMLSDLIFGVDVVAGSTLVNVTTCVSCQSLTAKRTII